jgi:hypothetical protein
MEIIYTAIALYGGICLGICLAYLIVYTIPDIIEEHKHKVWSAKVREENKDKTFFPKEFFAPNQYF